MMGKREIIFAVTSKYGDTASPLSFWRGAGGEVNFNIIFL
jgi:hypothetical protein